LKFSDGERKTRTKKFKDRPEGGVTVRGGEKGGHRIRELGGAWGGFSGLVNKKSAGKDSTEIRVYSVQG